MKNQKEFVESLFSKKERKKLWILPAITNKEIDLEQEKVVTWLHPSGHMGYVIYNDGKNISAFMMDRLTEKSESGKASMCSWCLSVKPAAQISLFSRKTSENTSNSIMLCSDLDCLHSISNPGMHAVRETLSSDEKKERYFKNLHDYVRMMAH
jgi:hypothetical protein